MSSPYPFGLRRQVYSLYTFRISPFSSALSRREFRRISLHPHSGFPICALNFSSSALPLPDWGSSPRNLFFYYKSLGAERVTPAPFNFMQPKDRAVSFHGSRRNKSRIIPLNASLGVVSNAFSSCPSRSLQELTMPAHRGRVDGHTLNPSQIFSARP